MYLLGFFEHGTYSIVREDSIELMPAIDFKCEKSELATLYSKDPRFSEEPTSRPVSPKSDKNFLWIDDFEEIFIVTTEPRHQIPTTSRNQANLFQIKCDISTFINQYKLKLINYSNGRVLDCLTKLTTVDLMEEDSVQRLLKYIMEHAKNMTNADRCSLWMVRKQTRDLQAVIFDGREVGTNRIIISMNQGVVGHVACSGEIYITQEISKDPTSAKARTKKLATKRGGFYVFQ